MRDRVKGLLKSVTILDYTAKLQSLRHSKKLTSF